MSKEFHIHFHEVKDKVFRFAKKILNNHEDAQDIVQDMFEKLWKMRMELPQYENIEAFAIRATKNMCLDRLKHEKTKQQKLEVVYRSSESATNVHDYEQQDVSDWIHTFIMELPEKQKQVMHLRDVEGMEYNEIAEIMEMDVQAIRMNLSRGRKTVKEKLIKTMNYGLQRG